MQSFDFTAALPKRTSSANTQRAYYRWVDRYLVDVAGLKQTRGDERIRRMESLPMRSLQKHLTPRKLRNWLNRLAEDGQGRQALDQARATIVTLTDLLVDAALLDATLSSEIQAVSVPPIKKKDSPERLLTPDEIVTLMQAAESMATSQNQLLRNRVVAITLCTMALRREELSGAKWSDLTVKEGNFYLQMGAQDWVDMPRPVFNAINRWRDLVQNPMPESPLVRRIWKGGRIAKDGLSPDGIWLIIRNASRHAGLEHVTPDDLRRSAVANMYRAGMPVEEISRILRHRSVLITERFLAKLPLDSDDNDS